MQQQPRDADTETDTDMAADTVGQKVMHADLARHFRAWDRKRKRRATSVACA